MFRSLFAASIFAMAAGFLAPALADTTYLPPNMSLSGHGEVRMAPDMAMVTAGVLSQANTAAAALAANTTAMQAVIAALKEAGIAAKDIQTTNFTVQPRYDYGNGNQAPRLLGYDVTNSVTVTMRKIEGLGGVLDRLVTAGSNQITGISFQVGRPEAALDEARKLAVGDAAHKAAIYAAAGKVNLGAILSISEAGGYQPPVPMQAKMVRADGAGAVPVAEGEQLISADVNIVWQIK